MACGMARNTLAVVTLVSLIVLFARHSASAEPVSRGAELRTNLIKAPATLTVLGAFRSHMVLQCDKSIAIWGWAPHGQEVSERL